MCISFNNYYGLFVTDTLDITPRLSGTVSARFNSAQITLRDQIGTDLNGSHGYNRLNPAVGLTYKILPNLTVYAGYAETNRAPTPAELSCADPLAPCSLTNFFVGDPNLNQVVAHTLEAGLRGSQASTTVRSWTGISVCSAPTVMTISCSSPAKPSDGHSSAMSGPTRRQGVETGLRFRTGRLNAYANYAFTDATFQTALTLSSENNPLADAAGNIQVRPGNRLPGVPRHLFKVGADYGITEKWVVGFSALVASGKYPDR